MILLKKLIFVVSAMAFLPQLCIKSQDLRDADHTRQFADYLFRSKQFLLASEEYERLVFYDSTNNQVKLRLIQSYRLAGKYSQSQQKFDLFFRDSLLFVKKDLAEEYVKNLILDKKFESSFQYLDKNRTIPDNSRQTYMLASIMLQKNWDSAFQFAFQSPVTQDKKNADLHVLAFQSKMLKYKKPFVAGLFSTIIPGTGKIYTKNWKDGLISMVFVGINAWQSYRGFKKDGSGSAYGWVFAGFAGSFYIGNIFGSCKSAKKYNKKIDDELYEKTWHLVVDDF